MGTAVLMAPQNCSPSAQNSAEGKQAERPVNVPNQSAATTKPGHLCHHASQRGGDKQCDLRMQRPHLCRPHSFATTAPKRSTTPLPAPNVSSRLLQSITMASIIQIASIISIAPAGLER